MIEIIEMIDVLLIVGIGNAFRQDDGIGIIVAKKLAVHQHPAVTIIEHRGEGMDLIEKWKTFQRVILIDAVQSGAQAGTIHHIKLPQQELPKNLFPCSTHALSIADTIALARQIDMLPEQIEIFGIEGKVFENGTEISPEVLKASEDIVDKITAEITILTVQRS